MEEGRAGGVAFGFAGVRVLHEIGAPLVDALTDEVVQAYDVVITMGCGDPRPVSPGNRYLDWEFDDRPGRGWRPSDRSATRSTPESASCSQNPGPGREPVAVAGPGRSCPLAYRYRPDDLAGPAAFDGPTLYVVGGLYGNTAALSAILEHAGQEPAPPEIVFNGDFHYLDADPDAFAAIADGVFGHRATLGNVEYALNSPDSGLGCGCDYPDYVSETVVENSNAIVERLRDTARAFPDHLGRLAELPRHLTVEVAGQRVGIVHGDPESLAGWRLALEAMVPGDQAVRERTGWTGAATTADTLADWFRRGQVDVLASTHTGLPYAQDITVDDRPRLVINNGAAGLGNFNDGAYGVLTRISADTRPPPDSLYGRVLGGLRCDAIPVRYDLPRAVTGFLTTWPVGSPAHSSYFDRLRGGTELDLTEAIRLG